VAGDGERCQPGEFLGPCQRIGEVTDAMHPAHRVEPARIDDFGGEQHGTSHRPAELTGEAFDRPVIDHQPETGRWHTESASRCGHTQVAGHGELGTGAERRPVDRGHHRQRKLGEPSEHLVEELCELALLDPVEVGAGTERGWFTGEDQHPRVVEVGLRGSELQQRVAVDGVAAGGPVEREHHDAGGHVVASFHPYHECHCMANEPIPDDPVRARRARVAHWTLLANRIGYLLLALAMALFVIAFAFGFSSTMAGLVIASLLASFALLLPSIVLGYAVKAAERADRELGV
jgi:hypothetical protein